MNVQSLSIAVPAGCPNKCRFCVSKMRDTKYENLVWSNERKLYGGDKMRDRMAFARDNGCNTMLFTGEGEPMRNKHFIFEVMRINSELSSPFKWVEIQTSGYSLIQADADWMRSIGISTVSLSVSDIFDDTSNVDIMQSPSFFKAQDICDMIKNAGLNLRVSMNLTSTYNSLFPNKGELDCSNLIDAAVFKIFNRLKELKADMVTFRKMYAYDDAHGEISEWIISHNFYDIHLQWLDNRIKRYGNKLERLPFGAVRYSFDGISTVIDDDCMSQKTDDVLKYLILRPDGKLYTRWDDKGSLLF